MKTGELIDKLRAMKNALIDHIPLTTEVRQKYQRAYEEIRDNLIENSKKSTEDWKAELHYLVDKSIEAQMHPDYFFMSEQDKVFLKDLFSGNVVKKNEEE